MADPEFQRAYPAMVPIQFGYRLWPLQQRNKREILENILNSSPSRMPVGRGGALVETMTFNGGSWV